MNKFKRGDIVKFGNAGFWGVVCYEADRTVRNKVRIDIFVEQASAYVERELVEPAYLYTGFDIETVPDEVISRAAMYQLMDA